MSAALWRSSAQRIPACGVVFCVGLLALAGAAPAQESGGVLVNSASERTFRIPFIVQPDDLPRIREIQLYYSMDQGRTWRHHATATPEQGRFEMFTAPQDGTYWFAVRTVDRQGKVNPPTDDGLRVALKVQVQQMAGSSQEGDNVPVTRTKDRTFRIPFAIQWGQDRLREVQLYCSLDHGKTWQWHATATAAAGGFQPFTAPTRGEYWFAVRTVDRQGNVYPPTDDGLRAGLKVLVDAEPPLLPPQQIPRPSYSEPQPGETS
jgi:hypothetical protein